MYKRQVESGEDLEWSAEEPSDLVFTVHLEPGSPAARTVESQTLELDVYKRQSWSWQCSTPSVLSL